MRHFIVFISLIFLGLFLAVLNKTETAPVSVSKPVLKVFGYTSFTGRWGPGPYLKDQFEKSCNCKVEFIESSDSGYLLQRLKFEGERHGADLVIGLDQYDIAKALEQNKWKPLTLGEVPIHESVRSLTTNGSFLPYDWGILAFIIRKNEFKVYPTSLDDLLKPEFNKKISIENPSTSSPGLQFLNWVYQTKGVDEGTTYLEKFLHQTHSVTPGWSEAYGLFKKKTVSTTLSYTTSPIYHLIEEKSDNYLALEFKEGHPIQVELMGIPATCRNCELAEKFAAYLLSVDGQKIIMEKNYMFPVRLDAIAENSPFAKAPHFKILDSLTVPSQVGLENYLQKWSVLRRGEK
jgi:thiamine transport system substrate-binding protein